MAAGGRRSLHSYRAWRVARYECASRRAALRAGGRPNANPHEGTYRLGASRQTQKDVPRYCSTAVALNKWCQDLQDSQRRDAGPDRQGGVDQPQLRCAMQRVVRTTVTAAATSATHTPVCRLSDTSSVASYSPATWTRRFPTRSGSSMKAARASKAASTAATATPGRQSGPPRARQARVTTGPAPVEGPGSPQAVCADPARGGCCARPPSAPRDAARPPPQPAALHQPKQAFEPGDGSGGTFGS